MRSFIFYASFFLFPLSGFAGDSTRHFSNYGWLREDLALIQFHNQSAVRSLVTAFKKNPRYVVAHFGDSHVQPDIISAELRKTLQLIKGDGGRGMVFPYTAARTHPAYDYSTRYHGQWLYSRNTDARPRLPLGLTGVTIRTTDPAAGFSIHFRSDLNPGARKLMLYCRKNEKSFDLSVSSEHELTEVDVYQQGNENGTVEINIPEFSGSIHFRIRKSEEQQTEFELYGLSIESIQNEGALVHSLGISGAPYGSLLQQSLLEDQLAIMKPDLVILDLGTNDYIPGNRIPMDMEIRITDVIRKIRRSLPEVDIILTTTQDMNRRGINMSAGRSFSLLIRNIAEKENCAFFDWYWVAGGPRTMQYWVRSSLAQRDNIHLTRAGYALKGKLLSEAFLNTIERLEKDPTITSLILHEDSIPLPLQARRDSLRQIPEPKQTYFRPSAGEIPAGTLITHTIKSGETLGGIAEKYGVSVTSIRELNGIYNSRILAGNKLKIVVKNQSSQSGLSAPSKHAVKSLPKNTIRHQITSGETLFSIAEKYKVSVDELKKLNNLPNSRIVAGKTLIVPITDPEERRNKS